MCSKAWFFACKPNRPWVLIISALVLLAIVSACSFSYVYSRIDTFALWKIDDYVTLSEPQEDWLELRLQAALRWHHREQLPRWRDWLLAFRTDVANNKMNAILYAQHIMELRTLVNDTSNGLIDDTVNLIQSLNDEQVNEFLTELEENLQDYKQRNIKRTLQEHQDTLYEKTSDNLIDWFGNLNQQQKLLVRQYAQQLPDARTLSITAREYWLQHITKVLAQRDQSEHLTQALKTMLLQPDALRSEEYRQWMELRKQRYRQLIDAVYQLATDAQTKHILNELDSWIEDFDDLMVREI